MKKIIFLDNDSERFNADYEMELDNAKRHMRSHFHIPKESIAEMQIIDELYHKLNEEGAKDKYMTLLFGSSDIVATYSMYTSSHFGSLYTFLFFVGFAGRYNVRNKVYLNLSSEDYMIDALNNNIEDEKRPIDILKCVQNNHFISYNHELKSLTKAVVDLSERYNVFKVVPISEEEFLKLIN